MCERPILFSSSMVRATLAGRKTQTRRVVKVDPCIFRLDRVERRDDSWSFFAPRDSGREMHGIACPYGVPGDRLWVREAWRLPAELDKDTAAAIAAKCEEAGWRLPWAPIEYLADGDQRNADVFRDFGDGSWGRKRSSRFMPRWASRITLEVTDVRVERVQDISENDAQSEGLRGPLIDPELDAIVNQIGTTPREAFCELWKHINGAESWDANPWVWVVSFRRVTP